MYLVQSRSKDLSTCDVIDWLKYLSKNEAICNINNSTTIDGISYRVNDRQQAGFRLKTDQGLYNSVDILGYWYRRGMFRFSNAGCSADPVFNSLSAKMQSNSNKEQCRLADSLYHLLYNTKAGGLNTFHDNFTNKIINLSEALAVGFKVPDTLITNDINELLGFADEHEFIITKDIEFDDILIPYDDQHVISIKTAVRLLSKEDVQLLSTKYVTQLVSNYAMFQQYIEKRYELRCFYLKGEVYTMAIFSQANERTKIDFRNYDQQRPNRCVPYNLPVAIEGQLRNFMRNARLNCGSIDIILTPDKEYVFLEVNPLGQFQWLSRNCNYNIERQIAKQLINN